MACSATLCLCLLLCRATGSLRGVEYFLCYTMPVLGMLLLTTGSSFSGNLVLGFSAMLCYALLSVLCYAVLFAMLPAKLC